MPNKLEISLLERLRREPLLNAAKGILPQTNLWGTPPTDLANITDGDPDTVSGTGVTVLGASGNIGDVEINFPQRGVYLVGAKVGIWSTTGTINTRWFSTPDYTTQQYIGAQSAAKTSTTEVVINVLPCIISGQEVSLMFNGGAAMTANVKIYEFWAFKLG